MARFSKRRGRKSNQKTDLIYLYKQKFFHKEELRSDREPLVQK